ncbi:hypothetical protein KGA66_28390 [Actinocrinis puniceicyclus]|uniref:CHRD domain-containing protein n=1 Tax=Actinocrinis puniceicyclus TaxID=977794 RepID=A0A8J7WR37_9ACTN|nr:hypothetical protein [Actinocrinis puniceicyclus]MBS2966986.1 hypothetical protein [Actinocrinis puniceicyclus]
MKTAFKAVAPLALLALPALTSGTAFADAAGSTTYTAQLSPVPLNNQNSASGSLTLSLNGSTATIHEQVSGLAATFMNAPYPHVQHIHGGAMGTCPTASADTNGDGVISTVEGQPAYGPIRTTLSVTGDTSPAAGTDLKIAPSGASFTYDRTITLDSATLDSIHKGIAVIVVHGLDPATAPKAASTEKSELVPSLPLAATSPALCGKLVAMPTGAAATGGGASQHTVNGGELAGGAGMLTAAGALLFLRRRRALGNR